MNPIFLSPSQGKTMNQWEQDTLNKIIRKMGPHFYKCIKCGEGNQFQTWPMPQLSTAAGLCARAAE